MLRHLVDGALIGLLASSGCAGLSLVVRTDRGQTVPINLQSVRPVEYGEAKLQEATGMFAEHLVAVHSEAARGEASRSARLLRPDDGGALVWGNEHQRPSGVPAILEERAALNLRQNSRISGGALSARMGGGEASIAPTTPRQFSEADRQADPGAGAGCAPVGSPHWRVPRGL